MVSGEAMVGSVVWFCGGVVVVWSRVTMQRWARTQRRRGSWCARLDGSGSVSVEWLVRVMERVLEFLKNVQVGGKI